MANFQLRPRSRPRQSKRPRPAGRAPAVETLEGRLLLASINEFSAGARPIAPSDITLGPDGALWFGEASGRIGRIGTDGQITEFSTGITGTNLTGITAGPDGNLWFTEFDADRIGQITPQGVVTEFPLLVSSIPNGIINPTRITAGSDGALWFTERGSDRIGRITTQGAFTSYFVVDANVDPTGITSGPDGNLWFVETGTDAIGVMSTQGVLLNQFTAGITAGAGLDSIANGPDGALWFTESNAGAIGRITTAGAVTEFPTGLGTGGPVGITLGPDGNLYFAEALGNNVARIATDGVVKRFPVPTPAVLPLGVATGADRNLWFTEYDGNKIGQLVLPDSITAGGNSLTVVPGQATTASFAAFVDISTATVADNFAATIDFGDGTTGAGTIQSIGSGQFSVVATHTYPFVGQYTATITIGTDAGTIAPVTSTVFAPSSITVTGTSLAATSNVPLMATFATFTNQVSNTTLFDYAATIDFGDGTSGPGTIQDAGNGRFAVVATHTYRVNQGEVAQIVVSNKTGAAPSATTSVNVTTGIAATGTAATTPAGRPATAIFATFGDQDSTSTAASYAATIAFGDGTSGPGTIRPDGQGGFFVSAAHSYASQGQYTATVTVSNAAGAAASVTAIVTAVSPVIVFGTTLAATTGQPLTADFATFGDVSGSTTADQYTATIDFGDNTTGAGLIRKTGVNIFAISATHTYATARLNVATILVRDSTGPAPAATTRVAVSDSLSTVVINTNDSGRGSLRQAILNANILPGLNTISFQIPGPGVQTIRPVTPLPPLTDQVVIDGATQAAFAGVVTTTPLIEVDGRGLAGQATGLGFRSGSAYSQVADLAIFGFHGPQIDLLSDNNAVIASELGLRADGTIPGTGGLLAAPDSSYEGVVVHGFGNRIGGLAAGQGNVISGNAGYGIDFKNDGSFGTSGFHSVLGNRIGLDPTGTVARGNGFDGILIEGGVNSVLVGAGNVISGNGGDGVALVGATGITIVGSRIGTDAAGTRSIGNAGAGVRLGLGSSFNQIGGASGDAPTLISGNGLLGVAILDGSRGNSVTNTWIGTDLSGGLPLGNGSTGLLISDSPANQVGPGNVISGNGSARDGAGVWIEGASSTGNVVSGNKVGTDISGTRRLGNAVVGILIVDASRNLVGGPGAGNLVSGNGQVGVMISGPGAFGNRVEGNRIGTNESGTGAIPNGQLLNRTRVGAGVYLNGAPGNIIGGATEATRNLISGNFADGVQVSSAGATGNQIRGNFIGTDVTGNLSLGNGRDGIVILAASRNTIANNVVSANRRNGLVIGGPTAVGNVIVANAIGLSASRSPLGNRAYGLLFTDGARSRSNTLAADNRIAANGSGQVRSTSSVPSAPPLVVPGNAKIRIAARTAPVKVQPRTTLFGGRALSRSSGKG